MNQVKLNKLIKSKTITIPLYTLRMCKDFNLTADEIILFFFLYDKDGFTFNPNDISKNINLELSKVMEVISKLSKKGFVNIVAKTNEHGIKEEIIDLSPFFDKLTLKVIEQLNNEELGDFNIYNILEEEFNRKLSPMECEMVDDWGKNGYSTELIKEATREAVLNGVSSLRYIDKILFEWNKKGYKTKEDIKKRNNNIKKEKVEIYTGNWLDSDEEL